MRGEKWEGSNRAEALDETTDQALRLTAMVEGADS
jgi:hypothetical protein